jgi:plasmid stabilization system protein ParE
LKVVLSREAHLDLMAQLVWLSNLSPAAARSADLAIRQQLRTLADFPAAGVAINADERKWPIRSDGTGLSPCIVSSPTVW